MFVLTTKSWFEINFRILCKAFAKFYIISSQMSLSNFIQEKRNLSSTTSVTNKHSLMLCTFNFPLLKLDTIPVMDWKIISRFFLWTLFSSLKLYLCHLICLYKIDGFTMWTVMHKLWGKSSHRAQNMMVSLWEEVVHIWGPLFFKIFKPPPSASPLPLSPSRSTSF